MGQLGYMTVQSLKALVFVTDMLRLLCLYLSLCVVVCALQASSQSMPWLADLVQSSEGSLDVLPVQCLCEFLLHDAADDSLPVDDDDEAEVRSSCMLWAKLQASPR